jgi:hypothetical protein
LFFLSVVLMIAVKRAHVDDYSLVVNQMSLPPKPPGRVEKK